MEVFPRGAGEGNKPTRHLVRMDYPGREENPPEVPQGKLNSPLARQFSEKFLRIAS
jgi:hypothetical protein